MNPSRQGLTGIGRQSYRFGPYRLDAGDRLLYRNGESVALPPKAADTLLLLVASGGRVLSRDEMLRELWPDTFVEEGTLTQYISVLRKALGEEGRWIENLPRRGYRFTAPVEVASSDGPEVAGQSLLTSPPEPTASVKPGIRLGYTLAMGLAVAGVALILAWIYYSRPSRIDSIAVLPFLNLSGDAKSDYIGDSLTEELTHALARLDGVRVAARTSAFQFRGRNEDVRRIGKQLNVDGVLEGSVRFDANTIRVTVQFVDARNGFHIWSESYEGRPEDLLTIQQRIGAAVAGKLSRRANGVNPRAVPRREVVLPYLQGRYFLAKGRPETFQKAVEAFKEVIAKDPGYARAHAGIADTYYRWALWENFAPGEAFSLARGAAERALALDESLAEAHASLANVKFQHEWDFAAAEREFRRSLELDPYRADTWHWFSHFLTAQGRFAESLEASRKAIELEPFDLPAQNHLGWVHYFAGDFDRSIEQHRKTLELDPVHGQTRLLLGRALVQRKSFGEAIEQLRRNLELSPESPERLAALAHAYAVSGDKRQAAQILDRLLLLGQRRYVAAYSIATVYAGLGAKDDTLAYLEKAVAERSARIVEVKYEPIFQALRGDPAFRRILGKVGL